MFDDVVLNDARHVFLLPPLVQIQIKYMQCMFLGLPPLKSKAVPVTGHGGLSTLLPSTPSIRIALL
jgi:hypothetical protein